MRGGGTEGREDRGGDRERSEMGKKGGRKLNRGGSNRKRIRRMAMCVRDAEHQCQDETDEGRERHISSVA